MVDEERREEAKGGDGRGRRKELRTGWRREEYPVQKKRGTTTAGEPGSGRAQHAQLENSREDTGM
eukprot:748228-Hanusia_phi.AAC.2